ncbi:DUF192 domain-containing protein [Maribacter halichondriae]|uniref:DUF192 domain-containing protein n=1 Tax=Maribacter halichondriae TaxID=2980554 RepID=UPI002359071C|nr:DUF192 domain-containing protein [Maribacter sp. Hal144]
MKLRFILYFIVSIVLLGSSCKNEPKKVVTTEPVVFTKEGELSIFNKDSDSLIAKLNIEFAETEYETQTGLMYRTSMEDDQGMLFIFPKEALHSFYMKNTEFSLDIIFIDADFKVASYQENAQPLTESGLSSKVPVQYVLEVNAGLVEKWSLDVGDTIEFNRLKP